MCRVRSDRVRCTVTTSAVAKSSCLETRRAPPAAAASSVRFWLQATTSMPKAGAIAATRLPRRPRPTTPRRRPARSVPSPVCQPPAFIAASFCGMRWARARISAQVSSTVPPPWLSVPQTMMPRSAAASRSIRMLRRPAVTMRRRSGSAAMTPRGRAVRSRIRQTASKPASACGRSASRMWRVTKVMSASSWSQSARSRAVSSQSSSMAIFIVSLLGSFRSCARRRWSVRRGAAPPGDAGGC